MGKIKTRNLLCALLGMVLLLGAALVGASYYMLGYSVGYAVQDRNSAGHWQARLRNECPWIGEWMDSVYGNHCVKDTFVSMPSGYKGHAIFLSAPTSTANTAIVVHGYKVRAEGMLHIAYLYNHDLGYNVLLPDLYGHGESEGDHIQMGWNDRHDVQRWMEVAHGIFPKSKQVLHGISMGAATVMAVSGDNTPLYLRCFVEDCGYTSVWDEFASQLEEQFGLPAFPLMYTTSELCRLKYGWSFGDGNMLAQVARSTKPMLFIHGDKDTFVAYHMQKSLYGAKTMGRKRMLVGKGSIHAMTYRDHHDEYTCEVRQFVSEAMEGR